MQSILTASKIILLKKSYFLVFLTLIIFTFSLAVFLQVLTIPGNTFSFQLKILTLSNYLLMLIVFFLVSLFITMQIFIFRNSYASQAKIVSVGTGGAAGYLAIFAAVLGTATCASCLFALFGFLGFGGIVFILKNQPYVVGLSVGILLFSLYFSSQKVNGVCKNCKVNKKKIK